MAPVLAVERFHICDWRWCKLVVVSLPSSVEGEMHLRGGMRAQDLAKCEGEEGVVLGCVTVVESMS
jgi:hypothetical protein